MTKPDLLVTIFINNYNYGRFLRQAIDSALNQTYENIEVIVVDDGSTDDSREIIASYGDRIIPVLKQNGGQASAFNAGIAASRGEIICLLDSDDYFHPDKVERVIPFSQPNSMLYHRLQMQPGTETIPHSVAQTFDFYLYAQQYRFIPYLGSPTSGLVVRRDLAMRLIPFPLQHVRSSADDFVVKGSALLGQIIGIPDILATYRLHGENAWHGKNKAKSHGFMNQLEEYLNGKLIEAGRAPVIDFYHSLYAREFVPQNAAELTRLGVSVFKHHRDFITLKFFVSTLARAALRAISPTSPRSHNEN